MNEDSSLTFVSFEELREPLSKYIEGSEKIDFNPCVIHQYDEEEERRNRINNVITKSCIADVNYIPLTPPLETIKKKYYNTFCSEEDKKFKLFLFGKEMKDGIYRITFISNGKYHTMFGLVKGSNDYSKESIHLLSYLEGVCFMDGMFHNYIEKGYNKEEELKEGDVISMEVNLKSKNPKERTLDFFINKRHLRVFYSHIPEYVKFGVCIIYFDFI